MQYNESKKLLESMILPVKKNNKNNRITIIIHTFISNRTVSGQGLKMENLSNP